MDIYTAATTVEKLLKYVQDIADSKPRMYNKSKVRLREIRETCQQVVKVVSEILQEAALEDTDEITYDSDKRDSEWAKTAKDIQAELDGLCQFVGYVPRQTSPVQGDPKPASTGKLSRELRRSIMLQYKEVLSDLPDKLKGYPAAYECANLLFRWFDIRFYRSIGYSPTFHYNIRRIPDWVADIVIVYGKHLTNGTSDDFIRSFNEWCDSLLNSESSNNYAVPYEVFKVDSDASKSDINLSAVILWDILFDNGMGTLCTPDSCQLPLSETLIYDIAANHHPDVLDLYTNYKVNKDILKMCNIYKLK